MPFIKYQYSARRDRFITILDLFNPNKNPKNTIVTVKALWDTGCTSSALSKQIISNLNLNKITNDVIKAQSVDRTIDCSAYYCGVAISPDIIFDNVRVQDTLDNNIFYDMLIGMDIINRGKLLIDSKDNLTEFSFSLNENTKNNKIDISFDVGFNSII